MPLNLSRFLQILAVVVQILNLALPVVPNGGKLYVTTLVGIIQVVLHNWASSVNPDGTPASEPYVKVPK